MTRKNKNYLTVDILVIVISNASRGKTVHRGRDEKVMRNEQREIIKFHL